PRAEGPRRRRGGGPIAPRAGTPPRALRRERHSLRHVPRSASVHVRAAPRGRLHARDGGGVARRLRPHERRDEKGGVRSARVASLGEVRPPAGGGGGGAGRPPRPPPPPPPPCRPG